MDRFDSVILFSNFVGILLFFRGDVKYEARNLHWILVELKLVSRLYTIWSVHIVWIGWLLHYIVIILLEFRFLLHCEPLYCEVLVSEKIMENWIIKWKKHQSNKDL